MPVICKGQIFRFRSRDYISWLIDHLAGGLKHSSPGGFERCTNDERFSHFGGFAKPNIEFTADTKSAAPPGRRPDHGLIEHRRQNSAVNDAFKTNVVRGRYEMSLHCAG